MRFLLAACLSVLLLGCGKSNSPTSNSGTAPALPSTVSLQIPQLANAGLAKAMSGDNFNAALYEIQYWTGTVANSIAQVESLWTVAQSSTPAANAGSWNWTLASGTAAATLTATPQGDTVAWALTITGSSAINYMTGTSSLAGDSGVWMLYEPGQIPSLRISYKFNAAAPDTIQFTNIRAGQAKLNSYLRFIINGDQRQIVAYQAEIPRIATITWSHSTGAGSYTANDLPAGIQLSWGPRVNGYPNM